MRDGLSVSMLGMLPARQDEFRLHELPATEDSYQYLKDRDATPDLWNSCPICGNHYQPGEDVLALARRSFATAALSSSWASAGEPGSSILLGHRECVLPRLLTLLASFRPDERFVRAVSSDEASLPSRQGQP